ncbi:MAG: DsbA family protein [Microbacterium gubbeenense]|uniref:DsbA family protein n=1 Tax=Microbacterium gubbeenense TaxID=159896 RepID=UPI003F9DB1EA
MAAAAKNRSVFAIVVSIIVVVAVVAVGIVVYLMNRQASEPATAPAAGVVNQETGAIEVGDGDQTVTEYIDFMCPICNPAHDAYNDTLSELITDGTITLQIHPMGMLDNQSQGTEYSSRSANAAYCVAEDNGDAFFPFMDLLFKNQPAEGTTGLDDDELVKYAEQAGAEGAASCITDGTYRDFVAEQLDAMPIMPGMQGRATPTILVNDEFVSPQGGFDAQADIVANLD